MSVALSLFLMFVLFGTKLVSADEVSLSDEQLQFFESRIRPVLVEHCYECHNSESAEAGLALDHRRGLRDGGASGSVLDPSTPSESLLLKVIRHDIDGQEMPEGGGKLAPSIIADMTRWVAMGAPDPRDSPPSAVELSASTSWEAIRRKRMSWWSFQPIAYVTPPTTDQHPVDAFIHEKLKQQGLKPAGTADRTVLLNRVAFALTGLPPTIQEKQDFLSDRSDQAMERLVDRYLSSPAFGERWARHWMDWIRYAESHGSEGDPRIENAWMYRDYLIRSLNKDISYRQMVREHIAGDLLQTPRIDDELQLNESLIATAHWRMVFHGFAPTDALDEKVRFTDDQIDTFSKAFLGLTVSCARCHNHKFDAISQKDYYALFGILGSTRPGRAAADAPGKLKKSTTELAELKSQIRRAIADAWLRDIDSVTEQISQLSSEGNNSELGLSRLKDLLNSSALADNWNTLKRETLERQRDSVSETEGEQQRWRFNQPQESGWYAHGEGISANVVPAGDFRILPDGATIMESILPAGLMSGSLSTRHAARLESPQFRLDGRYDIWMLVAGNGESAFRYVVQNYPRNGTVYPVRNLNSSRWSWQKLDVSYWNGDDIHLELTTARDAPLLVRGAERSWFGLREVRVLPHGTPLSSHHRESLLPVFAASSGAAPNTKNEVSTIVARAIRTAVSHWRTGILTDGEALLLDELMSANLLANRVDYLPGLKPLVDTYRERERSIATPTRVPTLAEWQGRDLPLFERGNHRQPTGPVPRRFLEALGSTPYSSELSGRLELAEDVLADSNPFTRRVIVNRVWHHLFGAGIVTTPDNFGRLGAEPSHPELLDYLARRFSDDDWSLKSLIRLIVTSQTWQQQSQASPFAIERDPENVFLSHANVRRLEAEAIRDRLLTASGQLDQRLAGPPVSGGSPRRSVYVSVIRNRLDPFLTTFDAPVPFGAKGRRDVTNVPAQSLLMLNDPFVVTAARKTADNVRGDRTLQTDEQRVIRLWRAILLRDPTAAETNEALQLVSRLEEQFDGQRNELAGLSKEIDDTSEQIENILAPARKAILNERQTGGLPNVDLEPIAHWDFESGTEDQLGLLDGELKGSARVENGQLVLDGRGWMQTPAMTRNLSAKTLEARFVLQTLDQRAGGVMSVQTTDGQQFDAIVFAEQQARRWMAGSDFFNRTESVDGPAEDSAGSASVCLSITYAEDGTISIYRNGVPYGRSYRKGVQMFAKDNTNILFGMRHGTNLSSGRMFRGKVLEARLFDRCLTPDEVRASADSRHTYVSHADILDALTVSNRTRLGVLETKKNRLVSQRSNAPKLPAQGQEWADLAHSLFNLKEFLYVR